MTPADALADHKQRLQSARDIISGHFASGVACEQLVRDWAQAVDAVLLSAWQYFNLPSSGLTLIAVGGYGRAELHPYSDIDIGILLPAPASEPTAKTLEGFLTFLWDIGLEVGHSVRTLADCVAQARADITVATNLMEARLLAGDTDFFTAMQQATGAQALWSGRDFFSAKLEEQRTRHRKFFDTGQNLEPNIKEAPGGLRDIQIIGWVAKRHFGAQTLHDLVTHGFLNEDEFRRLNAGQNFLWRVRFGLHLLTGRREDRLLFDFQKNIARQFGFSGATDAAERHNGKHHIEQFMKLFYRTQTELRRLNEMLLELFDETIQHGNHDAVILPINNRFQTYNGYLEVRDPRVFERTPFALLEMFLLMQQHEEIIGVRASTIRLLREHTARIDDGFRADIRNRSLFMEILRQPQRQGLQRMHRYGVLEAYLPVFAAVTGLMQFDLFHVYTVDEHTLTVVRNMQQFNQPHLAETLPLCVEIMARLPKPHLLYIAGLFHDIAKNRGGDHSVLGEQDAMQFCQQHSLSKYDTKLVAWLVRQHLLMSKTAQRMDISDPEVVHDFAGIVGDKTHLEYLYLLTVADIRATNPTLWTSWKDSLLRELYTATAHALRRGLENPIERQERIDEIQTEARAQLTQSPHPLADIEQLWKRVPGDYFLRHTPEEIAWHAHIIMQHGARDEPLVMLSPQSARGGSEIFVYTRDQDQLFAICTRVLDQQGLTVHDARIITSQDGYALDTYTVLEADDGNRIGNEYRAAAVTQALRSAISSGKVPSSEVRRVDRKLKNFRIPTQIHFSEDHKNSRTLMEVITTDRPGVLAKIAEAMHLCDVHLHNARIATFGERVEDLFYITDAHNQPIRDALKFECLTQTLTRALAA